MELRDYTRALRRSWPLLVVCVLLGGLLAAAVTWRQTKTYAATTTLLVSAADSTTGAASAYQGGLLSQQRVKSYADLLTSDRIAAAVVTALGLPDSPGALRGHLQAQAVPDTVLLRAVATDPDPHRAQRIADATGDAFAAAVAQIETPGPGREPPVRVTVWEKAKLPTAPVAPRPTRTITLGALLGLLAATAAAVARHRLDTSITTDTDITTTVGLPTLGAIGFDPAGARHPLTTDPATPSARAEAFRQLRTNLQFTDVDHPPRTIVISSSLPGEGKTTTACNLALTLARNGVRVALVEGDLRRPTFGTYLAIEPAAGLTSILIGAADLDDVLLPWGDPTSPLHVLPSGPLPPNPSELLGSRAMTSLLATLTHRFDLVLIDAPPLLPVTDAAVLAAATDGTLLVVRAGRTRREHLTHATTTLRAVDARILGTILNMIPVRKGDLANYYGHLYGRPTPTHTTPGHSRARHTIGTHRITIATQRKPHDHQPLPADEPDSTVAGTDVGGSGDPGGPVTDDLMTAQTTPLAFDAKTVTSRHRGRS